MDDIFDLYRTPKAPPKPKDDADGVASVLDDEFSKLGYPSTARLSILGDVGRENNWNRNIIFGGHNDPKNNARNRGIISWQGDRRANLDNYLKKQGVLGKNDDNELRAMARFMDEEIRSQYPDVHKTLTNPKSTYDASEALRKYIKYDPGNGYNTPDSQFRVKNNRIWAERAKKMGLGNVTPFGSFDEAISAYGGIANEVDDLDDDIFALYADSSVSDVPPSNATPEKPETLDAQMTVASDLKNMARSGVFFPNDGLNRGLEYANKLDQKQWGLFPDSKHNGQYLINLAKAKKLKLRTAKEIQDFIDKNPNALKTLGIVVEDVGNATQGTAVRAKDSKTGLELATGVVTNPVSAVEQAQNYQDQFPDAVIEVTDTDTVTDERKQLASQVLDDPRQLGGEFAEPVAPHEAPHLDRVSVLAPQTKKAIAPVRGQKVPQNAQKPQETAPQAPTQGEFVDTDVRFRYDTSKGDLTEQDKNATTAKLAEVTKVDYATVRQFLDNHDWFDTQETESERLAQAKGDVTQVRKIPAFVQNQIVEYATRRKANETALNTAREKVLAENTGLDTNPEMLDILAAKEAGFIGKYEAERKLAKSRDEYIDWLVAKGYARADAVEKAFGVKQDGGKQATALDRYLAWNPLSRLIVGERKEDTYKEVRKSILDDIEQYGSLANATKAYKQQEEERKLSVMGQPTEALKTAARYITKIPSTIVDTVAMATDLDPVTIGYEYVTGNETGVRKALLDVGEQWRNAVDKDLALMQNPAYKNDFVANELAEGLAQFAVQMIGAPLTGGASLALPLMEGSTAQYREADKAGADRATRITASAVGAMLAVPDVLLKAKYLKSLTGTGKLAFIENLTGGLFTKLAKQFTEKEAKQITKDTVGAFIKKALGNTALGFGGEYSQERLEDVGNKALAKATYKPELTWEEVVLPSAQEKRGYLAAGIAGIFGGTVETAIEKLSNDELKKGETELGKMLESDRISKTDYQRAVNKLSKEIETRIKRGTYFAKDAQIKREVKADEFAGGFTDAEKAEATDVKMDFDPKAEPTKITPKEPIPTPEVDATVPEQTTKGEKVREKGFGFVTKTVEEAPVEKAVEKAQTKTSDNIEKTFANVDIADNSDDYVYVSNQSAKIGALIEAETDPQKLKVLKLRQSQIQTNIKIATKKYAARLKERGDADKKVKQRFAKEAKQATDAQLLQYGQQLADISDQASGAAYTFRYDAIAKELRERGLEMPRANPNAPKEVDGIQAPTHTPATVAQKLDAVKELNKQKREALAEIEDEAKSLEAQGQLAEAKKLRDDVTAEYNEKILEAKKGSVSPEVQSETQATKTSGAQKIVPQKGFVYRATDSASVATGKDTSYANNLDWYDGQGFIIEAQRADGKRIDHHKGASRGAIADSDVTTVYYEPDGVGTDPVTFKKELVKMKAKFPQAKFVEIKSIENPDTGVFERHIVSPEAKGQQVTRTVGGITNVGEVVTNPRTKRQMVEFTKPNGTKGMSPYNDTWKPVDDSLRMALNASGESAASQEAINRVASENSQQLRRVAVNTFSKAERPILQNADAVDVQPMRGESIEYRGGNRNGEVIAQHAIINPAYRPPSLSKLPDAPTEGMKEVRHRATEDLAVNAKYTRNGSLIKFDNLEAYGLALQALEASQGKKLPDFFGQALSKQDAQQMQTVLAEFIPTLKGKQKTAMQRFAKTLDAASKEGIVRLALVPAAIAEESVHAVRLETMVADNVKNSQSKDWIDKTVASPLFKKSTVPQKYKGKEIQSIEFIDKIVAGQFEDLGIDPVADREEIITAVQDWADDYIATNGDIDTGALYEINKTSAYFADLIESSKEQSKGVEDTKIEPEQRTETGTDSPSDRVAPVVEAGESKPDGVKLQSRTPGKSGLEFDETKAEQAKTDGKKVAAISKLTGIEDYYTPQGNVETEANVDVILGEMTFDEAITQAMNAPPSPEASRVMAREAERLVGIAESYRQQGKGAEHLATLQRVGEIIGALKLRQLGAGREVEIQKMLRPLTPEAAVITAEYLYQMAFDKPLSIKQREDVFTYAQENQRLLGELATAEMKLAEANRVIAEIDNNVPEKKPANHQEALLNKYQKRKPIILAELRSRFPNSPVFNESPSMMMAIGNNESANQEVVIDPKTAELLKEYAIGQILTDRSYQAVIRELQDISGASDEQVKDIHAQAADEIRGAKEPQTEEAKKRIKIRKEHYAEADKRSGKLDAKAIATARKSIAELQRKIDEQDLATVRKQPTNSATVLELREKQKTLRKELRNLRKANTQTVKGLSRYGQKALNKNPEDIELAIAVDLLSNDKPKSMESVVLTLQNDYGFAPPEAKGIAQDAKQLIKELKAEDARARDKAKGISEEQREVINAKRAEQMKAANRLNNFLNKVTENPNVIKRFNDDFRIKLVANWGTQIFNAVQVGTMATPAQILLDIGEIGLRKLGVNIGEATDVRARDLLLPYGYMLSANRQIAEQALAQFPDLFFEVHKGLLGDIPIEPLKLADTKTGLSKLAHQWFDANAKYNEFATKWSGAKMFEMHFRNSVIASSFDQAIRKQTGGKQTLESVMKDGKLTEYITYPMAKRAAKRAMDVTFASEIDDPIGKGLKHVYDKVDNYLPVLLNPITYARFMYSTSKQAVINPLMFGAMDSTKLGGEGYSTRSIAKGALAYVTLLGAGAILSAIGGDDDKWYTLYPLGKNGPIIDIRRSYPLAAYFYIAHNVLQKANDKPMDTDILGGLLSLETEYYQHGAPMEFLGSVADVARQKKDVGDLGESTARLLGGYLSGFTRAAKPLRDIWAQVDADERAYREDPEGAKDKFINELSRSIPGIIRLSNQKKQTDIDGKVLEQPFPIGRIFGVNVVHPDFTREAGTKATQWANRLWQKEYDKMTPDEKRAYTLRNQLKKAVRAGKLDLDSASKRVDEYVKEGRLSKASGARLKSEMKLSPLEAKVKYEFGDNPNDIKILDDIWKRTTDMEKDDIRGVLQNKELSPETRQKYGVPEKPKKEAKVPVPKKAKNPLNKYLPKMKLADLAYAKDGGSDFEARPIEYPDSPDKWKGQRLSQNVIDRRKGSQLSEFIDKMNGGIESIRQAKFEGGTKAERQEARQIVNDQIAETRYVLRTKGADPKIAKQVLNELLKVRTRFK